MKSRIIFMQLILLSVALITCKQENKVENTIHPSPEEIGKLVTNFQFELIKYFKIFVDEIRNVKNQLNHLLNSKELPKTIEIIGMLYDINRGWVFNVSDFGEDFSYDTFQASRKEIFKIFFRDFFRVRLVA